MTRRVRVVVAAAVLGSVATVTTGGSSWAEAPSGEVSWVSAGDSYSSGEGVSGNQGSCAQSDLAYGPAAADLAREAGWDITAEAFTACTGHLIEDLFNQRPGNRNAALWDWGVEQGAPERVDLLTFSFGGNDIGFADLLIDCLPVPDSWKDAVLGAALTGLPGEVTGCDTPEQEVNARIAALLDPPRRGCEGGRQGDRRQGGPGYDCDLLIDDRGTPEPGDDLRGTLVDFYVHLADEHLSDRGHIVVVGYPNMFAPVGEWPGFVKIQCQGIGRGDTERLGRLAANLDHTLVQAVRAANEQLGRDRIHYLPRSIIYRDGSHELCGSGEDWLNGVSVSRGGGPPRIETSFHPNAAGHAATAQGLTQLLEPISFGTDASSVDLVNATMPPGTCGNETLGWPHDPIPLVNGEGESVNSAGGFGGAAITGATVIGYADFNADGITDALMRVDCFGSPIDMCCAGRASLLTFALPVTIGDGGSVELIGAPITGGDSNGAQRQISEISLDGTTVVTTEGIIYPEQYTEAQVGYPPGQILTVTYQFDGSQWVAG